MKISTLLHPIFLFFLLIILTFFLSWIGSIYDWKGIESLIESDTIRWMLSHLRTQLFQEPWFGRILLLMIGVGMMEHVQLFGVLKRLFSRHKITRKEQRSLILSVGFLLIYGLLITSLLLLPFSLLRSITGSIEGSPFSQSISTFLMVGMIGTSVFYGFSVGTYRSLSSLYAGLSYGIAQHAPFLLASLLVLQFFILFQYAGFPVLFGITPEIVQHLTTATLFGVLIHHLYTRKRENQKFD